MAIAENLALIKAGIANAISKRNLASAGSSSSLPVQLVAVSKTKPVEDLLIAFQAGQRHFGENYVKELVEKAPLLPKEIQWHFIGSIQTNKLKAIAAIPNMFVVETIESLKHALALDKVVASIRDTLQIYLQVNTSKEESKSGMNVNELQDIALEIVKTCPHLSITGLMTIGSTEASHSDGPNPDFETLKECKKLLETNHPDHFKDLVLSMGMSDDYQQAIIQGSTSVRVGSKIFGRRSTPTN